MMMGLPKLLTTDQGTEFKNALNTELMKSLGGEASFNYSISPPGICIHLDVIPL